METIIINVSMGDCKLMRQNNTVQIGYGYTYQYLRGIDLSFNK